VAPLEPTVTIEAAQEDRMAATRGRASDEVRVAEIMLEIEQARARIVDTIDALENEADLPARLGDVVSATASRFTARVLQRIPSPPNPLHDGSQAESVP
jgi:hypothetical protein